MSSPITVPLWLALVVALLAVWALLDRLLMPSARWFIRSRANKVLEERKRTARFPVRFSPETIQVLLDAFDRTERQAFGKADALQECVKLLPQFLSSSGSGIHLRNGGDGNKKGDQIGC